MKKLTRGMVLFASLLAVPSSQDSEVAFAEVFQYQVDPRIEAIRDFFAQYDCPAASLALDFVAAADHYGLDWRLLPSIAFVESTGGKDFRNNNILGWDNGRQEFRSVGAGIYYVGYQLAHSSLYRNKPLERKLLTYNPRPEYARLVRGVMDSIGPETLSPAP